MNRRSILVRIAILLVVAALLSVLLIQGTKGELLVFANGEMDVVLDETFDLSGIEDVALDILWLDVSVVASDAPEARVVLESNLPPQSRAQIAVERQGNTFRVEQMPATWRLTFGARERLTLHLPAAYAQAFSARLRSGNLHMTDAWKLSTLSLWLTSGNMTAGDVTCNTYTVQCTSGNVTLGNVAGNGSLNMTSGNLRILSLSGDKHTLHASSGAMRIGALQGTVEQTMSSGTVEVGGLDGQGSFHSSSGTMRVAVTRMTGNLSLHCTSGTIRATMPQDAAFYFEGHTTSGGVKTDFAAQKDGRRTTAAVGNAPTYTLRCETTSGSIKVQYP